MVLILCRDGSDKSQIKQLLIAIHKVFNGENIPNNAREGEHTVTLSASLTSEFAAFRAGRAKPSPLKTAAVAIPSEQTTFFVGK